MNRGENANNDDDQDLLARLRRWTECFSTATIQWGRLLTDTTTANSTSADELQRCHWGVIVELPVDLTTSLLDEEDEFEHLLQVREAIDVVRLALATHPAQMAQLLTEPRRASATIFIEDDDEDEEEEDQVDRETTDNKTSHDITNTRQDRDAVAALARGVRVELRLQFKFESLKTRLLVQQLATYFLQELGQTLSTNAEFVALREELLLQLPDPKARDLLAPVRVTLQVDSTEIEDFSLLDADDFFVFLAAFSRKLDADQRSSSLDSTKWAIATRHAPLVVHKIELSLHRFCITHRVVQSAQSFMDAGIPVDCKMLNLDLRLISCNDTDLQTFVTAITRGATQLRVDTGVDLNEEDNGQIYPVDEEGQDRRDRIDMVLRAIASIDRIHELNLGGLLVLCEEPRNREAVWRGMVELFWSSRTTITPLAVLALRGYVCVNENDGEIIQRVAAAYKATHPDTKFHVQRLEMELSDTITNEGVRQLLLALDDAQQVQLRVSGQVEPIPTAVQLAILRLPSLRHLDLRTVAIETMDLFDPSIADPRLPHQKPVLQELVLDQVEMQDTTSVVRFCNQLKPTSLPANGTALATTLQRLHLLESDSGWHRHRRGNQNIPQRIMAHDARVALDDALATNRVLSDVRVAIDLAETTACEHESRLMKHHTSHLPAVPSLCGSRAATADHVKARNLAFLSVIREPATTTTISTTTGNGSARYGMDARVVSLILELSAPHVTRHVRVDPLEN